MWCSSRGSWSSQRNKIKRSTSCKTCGTNFELGKKILEDPDLKILSASDLNDAAKKIVEAIK